MPPTEPLAVFHLVGEGAFSEGLVQIAWALDQGRGFILFSASSHTLKGGINREHARAMLLAGSHPRVRMPIETMALWSDESRLMKSYVDI